MKKFPKRSIKENRYGNWYGYEGGRRVESFGNDGTFTQEENAKRWLERETNADMMIEDLLKAEDAISGLAAAAEAGHEEEDDVVAAVKRRAGYKDIEDRIHALAQDISDVIDSL